VKLECVDMMWMDKGEKVILSAEDRAF